jgi:ABC-2 type transport system ATP-binding protein
MKTTDRQADVSVSAGLPPAEARPARPPALAPAVEPRPAATQTPVLLFDRVSKWYGPVLGVNQVTLELRGGITGLVGANGAGKTTLLRLATGQLRPDLGGVRVLGHDPWGEAGKRLVGYCPDADAFYEEMSGRQFVYAMARLCGYDGGAARRRTEEALDVVGMTGRCDRPIAGYSKGMRQRVKMAQALLHDPRLLILDEPLSGIDPVGRQEFVGLYRELAGRGKCLLVSSHELEELEKLTDHVAVMARGRIAAVGTLTQIRDLLDDQPLAVRLEGDQPRRLAAALLGLEEVVGVELEEGGALVVRARNPRKFFQAVTTLVLEEGHEVRHIETLDDSAEAILGYLLGGRRGA